MTKLVKAALVKFHILILNSDLTIPTLLLLYVQNLIYEQLYMRYKSNAFHCFYFLVSRLTILLQFYDSTEVGILCGFHLLTTFETLKCIIFA